jgi:hypothetical protein
VNAGREVPVACTLSADELPARRRQIRSLGKDGLLSVEHDARRAIFRFRSGAQMRRRIDEIVEAESRCCAFLDFRVVEEAGGATRLTISAPGGGEPALSEFAALFTAAR